MGLLKTLFRSENDIKIEALYVEKVIKTVLISDFTVTSIELKTINQSEKNIYIEKPVIILPKKISGSYEHAVSVSSDIYPFLLKYSTTHTIHITLPIAIFDKLRSGSKIRFLVRDTFGNKHTSKKYRVSELTHNH